jgi:hypothetical protein
MTLDSGSDPVLLGEGIQHPPRLSLSLYMDYIASPPTPISLHFFFFTKVHVFFCYYMVIMIDLQVNTTAEFFVDEYIVKLQGHVDFVFSLLFFLFSS